MSESQPPPPEKKRRISITKLQRNTAAAAELIALCQTVTEDGAIADDEVSALRQWLADHRESDLPARAFLFETVERILADGRVTDDERRELYKAIETALPRHKGLGQRQTPFDREHSEGGGPRREGGGA